jgi:hypothetical protein
VYIHQSHWHVQHLHVNKITAADIHEVATAAVQMMQTASSGVVSGDSYNNKLTMFQFIL